MADEKEKDGRVLLSVWIEKTTLKAIDRQAAKLQEQKTERVHRSDVVREILDEWAEKQG